jgi:hypothetical protein
MLNISCLEMKINDLRGKAGSAMALPFLFISFDNHQSLGHYAFVDL